jgi:hypothetical protein
VPRTTTASPSVLRILMLRAVLEHWEARASGAAGVSAASSTGSSA